MWMGVHALKMKEPCLIVDFHGMKEFSAPQIVANLKDRWPQLHAAHIPFPDTGHLSEVYTNQLAQSLELPETREKLAQLLRPHLSGMRAIGLPAVMGLQKTKEVLSDLTAKFGMPVFEIPTMSASVPGLRLKDAFESLLPTLGVEQHLQRQVLKAKSLRGGGFVLNIGHEEPAHHIRTKAMILATGHFLGKGLIAERDRIREALLGLPVYQPTHRNKWHDDNFFNLPGHAVNQAGLEVDEKFRPLKAGGSPVFPALFAAGTILAHQDWMRMKCGSGIAIATAYGAVKAFLESRNNPKLIQIF